MPHLPEKFFTVVTGIDQTVVPSKQFLLTVAGYLAKVRIRIPDHTFLIGDGYNGAVIQRVFIVRKLIDRFFEQFFRPQSFAYIPKVQHDSADLRLLEPVGENSFQINEMSVKVPAAQLTGHRGTWLFAQLIKQSANSGLVGRMNNIFKTNRMPALVVKPGNTRGRGASVNKVKVGVK